MYYYAQLNEENICNGVSSFKTELENEKLIQIQQYDENYLWRKYENGVWSEEKFLPIVAESQPTIGERILFENEYQTTLLEMVTLGGI